MLCFALVTCFLVVADIEVVIAREWRELCILELSSHVAQISVAKDGCEGDRWGRSFWYNFLLLENIRAAEWLRRGRRTKIIHIIVNYYRSDISSILRHLAGWEWRRGM